MRLCNCNYHLRSSIYALGLSLGVLIVTASGAPAKGSDGHRYSSFTSHKGGKHANLRTSGKAKPHGRKSRTRWVRVKIKKHKKARTQWALIRKDRYQYATLLAEEAQRQGVPVRIAIAVGIQESGLNPRALGDKGKSYGLMQIKCTTARGIGYSGRCSGLYDPHVNAYWGLRYLKMALDGGGVWKYNQGIHARRPVRMAARYQEAVHQKAGAVVLAGFGLLP